MNQKGFVNIAIIIGVIIFVGVAGYFVFFRKQEIAQVPTNTQQNTQPSDNSVDTGPSVNEKLNGQIFRSERFDFEVRYPSNFVVENTYEHTYPDQGHIHFYKKSDYEKLLEYRAQDRPVEGWPPTIEFSVYLNSKKSTTDDLVRNGYSNFSKGTPYSIKSVAGQKAIEYHWSGLGGGDSLLFTTDKYIFELGTISIDEGTDLRDDFLKMIPTFRFIE